MCESFLGNAETYFIVVNDGTYFSELIWLSLPGNEQIWFSIITNRSDDSVIHSKAITFTFKINQSTELEKARIRYLCCDSWLFVFFSIPTECFESRNNRLNNIEFQVALHYNLFDISTECSYVWFAIDLFMFPNIQDIFLALMRFYFNFCSRWCTYKLDANIHS